MRMEIGEFALENICRICGISLEETSSLLIFSTSQLNNGVPSSIITMLNALNVNIKPDDGLSQNMCDDCFQTLLSIKDFIKKCKQIQVNFGILKEISVKEEVENATNIETILQEECEIKFEDESLMETKEEDDATHMKDKPENETEDKSALAGNIIEDASGIWVVDHSLEQNIIQKRKAKKRKEAVDEIRMETGLQCKFCKRYFAKLNGHILRCSKRTVAICKYCYVEAATEEEQTKHMMEKHPDKLRYCSTCSKTFDTVAEWKVHKEKGHKPKNTTCKICEKEYSTEKTMLRHYRTIHCEKIDRSCPICEKVFPTLVRYNHHMKWHEPDEKKRYNCQYCGKGFQCKQHKINHERTHTNERPYLCDSCGKSFRTATDLDLHKNSKHSDMKTIKFVKKRYICVKKRHLCDICGATLSSKSILNFHKMRHAKPIKCTKYGCNTRFALQSALLRHLEVSHSDKATVYPFTCTICSRGFSHATGLAFHVKKHNDFRPFQCDLCPDNFKTSKHLDSHKRRIHIKEKKFTCPHCNKKFCDNYDLNGHIVIHSDIKSHCCEICPAAFKKKSCLRIHMRIHTGEKPYRCLVCSKQFHNGSSLQAHSKSHSEGDMKLVEEQILRIIDEPTNENLPLPFEK